MALPTQRPFSKEKRDLKKTRKKDKRCKDPMNQMWYNNADTIIPLSKFKWLSRFIQQRQLAYTGQQ